MLFHIVIYYIIRNIILYYTQVGPGDRPARPAAARPRGARGSGGRPRPPAGVRGAQPPGKRKIWFCSTLQDLSFSLVNTKL